MSDDELRALERAAVDSPSRIRYAQALARVGRVEESIALLAPFVADGNVRGAIARLPATPPVPIESEPRKLWEVDSRNLGGTRLHAGPLAVVLADMTFTHVIAAAHGLYWFGIENHDAIGVVGNVVVLQPSGSKLPKLVGYDFVERRRLWELPITTGPSQLDGRRLVVPDGLGFVEHDLHDPERLPLAKGPCGPPQGEHLQDQGSPEIAVGDVVYSCAPARPVVEGRRAGRIIWTADVGHPVKQLAVFGSRLYAATTASRLVCLARAAPRSDVASPSR